MKMTAEILNNYFESHKNYIEICKIYNETRGAIHKLSKEIWSYIYKNYAEYLEFGKDSDFDEWDIDDTDLTIKYLRAYYDLDEHDWFYIPLSVIYNDTWKEFINDYFNKIKAEEEAEKAVREVREKEQRQKLYEKLKQEFEDGK